MKNKPIRKQCADILRYLRKHNKHGLSRLEVETDQCFLHIHYYTLSDFINASNDLSIDPSKIYFRYSEEEDCEEYKNGILTLYTYDKIDDNQYHNYLCECILPSEYEMNEYKQYLMLKKKYEGEQ